MIVLLHENSTVGIIGGICVYMEGSIEVWVVQSCGIDKTNLYLSEGFKTLDRPGLFPFDLIRSRRGAAKVGNLGMKRRKYPARPKKDLMLFTVCLRSDSGHDCRT